MYTKDHAKFNIVLVVGAIEKNGKFLIAQRSKEELQAPGVWALPGGKVEVEGSDIDVLEKTLFREIEEEVGVKVYKNPVYVKSSSFIRVDKSPVVGVLFLCKWKSGKPRPLEDSIDVKWISVKDIPKYEFAEGVDRAIKEAHEKLKIMEG